MPAFYPCVVLALLSMSLALADNTNQDALRTACHNSIGSCYTTYLDGQAINVLELETQSRVTVRKSVSIIVYCLLMVIEKKCF